MIESAQFQDVVVLVERQPHLSSVLRGASEQWPLPARVLTPVELLGALERWCAGIPCPRLVIVDVDCLDAAGLDLLRRLKSHPSCHVIPVVVLVAAGDDRLVHALYGYGVNSCVTKPADDRQLREMMVRLHTYWARFNAPPPRRLVAGLFA